MRAFDAVRRHCRRSLPAVVSVLLLTPSGASAAADPALPVEVLRPTPERSARTLELTGSVTAERDAALSSRVSGLVQRVRVDAGAQVRRGDILLELDPALAELALARADAALAEGRARLSEAMRLRDEARPLTAAGLLPKSQFQTLEANVVLADAAVKRLLADRREQAELVARHRLPAPFDGVIRRRLVDAGEWIGTGTPVLELVATDALRIDVQVPQQHLAQLAADARAEVELDARPGVRHVAPVLARIPASDPATRTFLVRVGVDPKATSATPGMSARVRFTLDAGTTVLVLPRDAVKRYPDGTTTVWVVDGSGTAAIAREQRVELEAGGGERARVLEGLAADAVVVVRGNEALKAGQPVQVRPSAADKG